jgi:hypothetical protein
MLRLDDRVERWRADLLRHAAITPDAADELEDHLRSRIAQRTDQGQPEQGAFEAAAADIGSPRALAREFTREGGSMSISSKLTGFAIIIGLFAVSCGSLGLAFIDIPSLLLVVGVTIGGLWAGFGPRLLLEAGRATIAPGDVDPARAAALATVFRRGYQLAWASGGLGLLTGIILMLANLDDPSRIGPGLALCMLSLLYGGAIAELFFRNGPVWLGVTVGSANLLITNPSTAAPPPATRGGSDR